MEESRVRACRRMLVLFAGLALAVPALNGCATGPSTKAQLCAGFEELSQQLIKGNGIIGNPLFREVKSLGSVAERYDDAGVKADGAKLTAIGSSESTSGLELTDASSKIAAECGKPPLAINGFTGGGSKAKK